MLPEELRTKLVENKETSHFLGLTFAVVGIVQLAGGKVLEGKFLKQIKIFLKYFCNETKNISQHHLPADTLWQHLRRLGLDEHDEKHPHFGNVKQAIETIIKQR